MSAMRNDDASRHVNHLQRSFAVDNDVAVVDESKGLIIVVGVRANEHQFETTGVVGRLGGEGLFGWSLSLSKGQQIHVCTSHVVHQMQVGHLNVLSVDAYFFAFVGNTRVLSPCTLDL